MDGKKQEKNEFIRHGAEEEEGEIYKCNEIKMTLTKGEEDADNFRMVNVNI